MGHDIYGFKGEQEVAYLRRSAFDQKNKTIYNALGADNCYAGVSGNGVSQNYTLLELIEAMCVLPTDKEYMPEIKFLANCIANCEDGLEIHFG